MASAKKSTTNARARAAESAKQRAEAAAREAKAREHIGAQEYDEAGDIAALAKVSPFGLRRKTAVKSSTSTSEE